MNPQTATSSIGLTYNVILSIQFKATLISAILIKSVSAFKEGNEGCSAIKAVIIYER